MYLLFHQEIGQPVRLNYMVVIPPAFGLNPLATKDVYVHRTAQLTSRRCISNIYSTNILTEYFKHATHSPFFLRCRLFHNAVFFGSWNIHISNTGCAKILKKIPAPKG